MNLQFAVVRLGQLAERVPIPGLCPAEQVGYLHSLLPHALGPFVSSNTDTDRATN